ncbi:uncharacterized protein [Odocoileus virginianus]|uniref:Uncharacterized protein n=1 Tax=Odocoileus virginianus TaxID=9874 RepID=A0ABM4HUK0_ODOVR
MRASVDECGYTRGDVCLAGKVGCSGRGVGGGSRGSAPGGGELRAEDGLVPSGRHVAVPVAPEPERPLEAPVGSARWGPADARNLQPTCLPICPPTRRSVAGSCAPKGPGKTCPGVWVPSDPCLRLPALGRGYGRGVLRLLFSREESAPSPPQPSLQVRLGRPGRPQLWRPVLRKVLETKPVSVIWDSRAPHPLPPWKEKVPKGCWASSTLHSCKLRSHVLPGDCHVAGEPPHTCYPRHNGFPSGSSGAKGLRWRSLLTRKPPSLPRPSSSDLPDCWSLSAAV